MARSQFGRFRDGVEISGISLNVHQKGLVFYVCNSTTILPRSRGASDQNDGRTPERPMATIQGALGRCVADRGDKIIVMPGHAETIADAVTLTPNVAGVAIIGVGDGADKPVLTLSATSSNIPVSAASMAIKGIRMVPSIDQVVVGMTVSAAGVVLDIETNDAAANKEFVNPISFTAGAANVDVTWKHRGFTTGSHMTRGLDIVGVVDGRFNIDFYGKASVAIANMRTTACKDCKFVGTFYNASAALSKDVVDSTSSTWSLDGFDGFGGDGVAASDQAGVHYVAQQPANVTLVSAIKALPQTATSPGLTAVTITGGPILIEELSMEITTVVQNQACTVQFALTDTASSTTTNISGASSSIAQMAVGSFLRLDPVALSTAPVIGATGGAYLGNPATGNGALGGVFCAPGTIGIITSANNSGNYKLHLRYKSLDPNAAVVLA